MRQRVISVSIAALLSSPVNAFLASQTRRGANSIRFIAPCLLLSYSSRLATTKAEQNNNDSIKMKMSNGTCLDDYTDAVDEEYPGTAVLRMMSVRARVATLSESDLSGDWENVRQKILWAGGLQDLPSHIPGQGYTGHSFNDYNHVDLTTMRDNASDNENDGKVKGIAIGNNLGNGIRVASIPELGPGGSWSTCANGCHVDPPQDVAHVQFRSRIAFKLVWAPTENFDTFVLVDDDGKELARGNPRGALPALRQRQMNYRIVSGSKYAAVADEIASG